MYKLKGNLNLAELQKEVIEKWKKDDDFKRSILNRKDAKEFVFYDGPPFANGLPHYGHLLTSYIKDTVARFQTMAGKKTERRFGWDCHGLPAEMETEKELGVSGRTQIMDYGIEKFNNSCRASVMKYSKQWQEYIEKAGRWVDFEEDYRTMDTPYMESVLWGFKQLYLKGLLYEDFRVMPYSWKCETPLSNFETRMDNSYRSHASKTAIVKFELKTKPFELKNYKTYVLIWTTTPWTLPSNLAIAVNPKITYVALKTGENEVCILAKNLAPKYEKELGKEVILELLGSELINLKYKPLFKFFENTQNAFQIIKGNFVEEEGGTGLVHIAPGFGEDDWQASKEVGIKIVCPVNDSGCFTKELYPYIDYKTERLQFRNIEKEDEPLIKILLEKHAEMHFEGANNSALFYQNHLAKYGLAPMAVIFEGKMIGIAGVLSHNPELDLIEGNTEVLCFLKEEFKGKGLGQEAVKFFAKVCFAKLAVSSVLAVISGENHSSFNMLTSIGFKSLGKVLDPRAKKEVEKFELVKFPEVFNLQALEFSKKGSLPLGINYEVNQNTYFVYENKELVCIFDISSNNLNFIEIKKDVTYVVLKEALNRFAYDEVYLKAQMNPELKKLGFFEIKNNDVKILKRNSEVLNLAGRQVFETNEDILTFLKYSGGLIKQEQYIHNYPHCWRTDTPLIYKAVSSWYVEVTKIKEKMVELNKQITWIPEHIKEGQFGKWLENARDWSITRNRFWGTPVPVWRSVNEKGEEETLKTFSILNLQNLIDTLNGFKKQQEGIKESFKINEFWNIMVKSSEASLFFPTLEEACLFDYNEIIFPVTLSFKRNYVFGSLLELKNFFGTEVQDLHRPFIDELEITDPYNKNNKIKRISDVLDCWFESGSMPFASVHYPFENKEWFETHNPADFIVEYVAQTRGWFYTLMVLGTAIFEKAPFKTCLCHGVILDVNGQKLSKRLRNYPDPLEVFETLGSDAMRFFLLSSSVVTGGDLNISKEGAEIREVVRLVIKPIWNAYTFFAMYANADGLKGEYSFNSKNIMDKYIFSKLSFFANEVNQEMANYNFPGACKKIEEFIDILNNWYIRRSKDRFWKEEKDEEKQTAYNTLYTVLIEFCKCVAPILPFTSESLYGVLLNN